MTTQADLELVRSRWRRHLVGHALDTTDRPDFSLGGLGGRVRRLTGRLLLLPPDPDREAITIDAELWDRLDELKTVDLGELGRVRLGEHQVPTAHAAALVNHHGHNEPWNSYVAVHRNGSIDIGFGDRGGRDTKQRDGEDVRVFNLISLVGHSWAAFELARCLAYEPDGPWHLAFALFHTDARGDHARCHSGAVELHRWNSSSTPPIWSTRSTSVPSGPMDGRARLPDCRRRVHRRTSNVLGVDVFDMSIVCPIRRAQRR